MESYIGAKIIKATPMTDLEFEAERSRFESAQGTVRAYKEGLNLLRGGELCAGVKGVCREPKDGYKVMYPDGYFSWSPKSVFENAYRKITQLEKEII